MRRPRGHFRRGRRAINEVIGAVLMVALTMVAGVILWSFHVNQTPVAPTIRFSITTSESVPAWGDPTDCQPVGTWTYPLNATELAGNGYGEWGNLWYNQCLNGVSGAFSPINATDITITSHTPANIPIADITLQFVCNNASSLGGRTVMLSGSLASMIWFPGVTTQAAPNAPHLGYCGNFDAGNWSGVPDLLPANGALYNRFGMFEPLSQNFSQLANGDTFVVYLHEGGWPITYLCVAVDAGLYSSWDCPSGLAHTPQLDFDDYHGAPPWCFLSPTACVIYLTYTGTPATVLAEIPVNTLAPARQ